LNFIYIILAIVLFGLLIFTHELGHFLAARVFGVRVNEFAMGMGPIILKKQRGETLFTLRLLPVGGLCAMEGEDENSNDPGSFTTKPAWQRLIIIIAGAVMNFLSGLLILVLLYLPTKQYLTPVIADFMDGCPYVGTEAFMEGDRILEINGYHIYSRSDIDIFLQHDASPYDILVERGGEKVLLDNFKFEKVEYPDGEGGTELKFGLIFELKNAGFGDKIRLALLDSLDFVRMVKVSLFDLFSGRAGVKDLTGPVGLTSVLGETARVSLTSMWMLVALIAINLAVMNLLPLPALDGGRVFFLFIELLRGKPVNPKYEGYVHMVGLALLLMLMVYVSFNDIARLVS
jgi:regulator of sigma E protease